MKDDNIRILDTLTYDQLCNHINIYKQPKYGDLAKLESEAETTLRMFNELLTGVNGWGRPALQPFGSKQIQIVIWNKYNHRKLREPFSGINSVFRVVAKAWLYAQWSQPRVIEPTFKTGDVVRCVDASSQKNGPPIKKGAVYVVQDVVACAGCEGKKVDVGITSDTKVECACGRVNPMDGRWLMRASRFKAII